MRPPTSFAGYHAVALETAAQIEALWSAMEGEAFPLPQPEQLDANGLPALTTEQPVVRELTVGWCSPRDPGKPLDREESEVDAELLVVGIRVDVRKVDSKLLELETSAAVDRWRKQEGKPDGKPPAKLKKELKEEARSRLLRKTPAIPHHAVVVYDHLQGSLYALQATGPAVEALPLLWRATLGKLLPATELPTITPIDRIEPVLTDEELEELSSGGRNERGRRLQAEHAGRFLLWLWHKSESAVEDLPRAGRPEVAEVRWLASKEVHVADGDTGKRRMSVRAQDAAEDPALRAALVSGHAIDGLGLTLETGGHSEIGRVTLAVVRSQLTITKIELPKLPAERDWTLSLLEVHHGIVSIQSAVAELFLAWARTAGRPDARKQYASTVDRWLRLELGAWLDGGASVN